MIALLTNTCIWARLAEEPFTPPARSCLFVWHKDGSTVIFDLDELPKITYEGDSVVIESSTTVKYSCQSIRKMTYGGEDVIDGIAELPAKKDRLFSSKGGTVTFLPSDKDLHVKVVSMNGIVIRDFMVNRNEPVSVSLKSYRSNTYMISVNGVTYKIAIR